MRKPQSVPVRLMNSERRWNVKGTSLARGGGSCGVAGGGRCPKRDWIRVKTDVQKGDLLIASVSLLDPNFQRTVVLLCEHSDAEGSYGLVLNRPIDVPAGLDDQLGFAAGALFVGGPVRQDALQVLHRLGDCVPGGVEVVPGVWIGGDFAIIRQGLDSGEFSQRDCRFYLGYSGWSEGQLAREMETDSWLTVQATADLVFFEDARRQWLAAVRARGCVAPMLANYPEDPRWN